MACGWLTDKFGLCWQIVPEMIGEILKHPKAMAAMMKMVKFDIATLEPRRRSNGQRPSRETGKGPSHQRRPLQSLRLAAASVNGR
jgi:3-demethylubiquinone-9 3-methyltransferase